MATFAALTRDDIARTKQALDARLSGQGTLEEAAQAFVETLYQEFDGDSVLVRLYCTIAHADLPDQYRTFVHGVAEDNGVTERLIEGTPVLSLLGSVGKEAGWCDARKSHGHLGIPLVSSAFVDAIPMVSRLLQQMGIGIDWIDRADLRSAIPGAAKLSGFFYVPNAANEKDSRGRYVIPAQDFVEDYGIKTVFGVGAAYGGGHMAVAIVFATSPVTVAGARQLQTLIDAFVSSTTSLVGSGALFKG